MPYVPLSLPDHVPEPVIRQVIRPVVDVALREIRLIMMIGDPESGPKGTLQLSIAKLLLSAIDGASNLLVSGERHNGPRFRRFLRENFAWERIEAEQASVCEFMWESARPLPHPCPSRPISPAPVPPVRASPPPRTLRQICRSSQKH